MCFGQRLAQVPQSVTKVGFIVVLILNFSYLPDDLTEKHELAYIL